MRTSGPAETHNRHHKAFIEIIRNAIRISDFVIEILDARDIVLSRNKDAEEIAREYEKKIIYVINKIDLINIDELKNSEAFKELGNTVLISVKKKEGIRKLRERIIIDAKKISGDKRKHVTVIGYPNVGKSSLINILVRRNAAPVSNEAGWTRAVRKVRFNKDILLFDVPGLIGKEESFALGEENLKNQTRIGVQTPERTRDPEFVVADLVKNNPEKFDKFYGLEVDGDSELLLDELGKRWSFLKKKGQIDSDRTARKILTDWRDGKIQ